MDDIKKKRLIESIGKEAKLILRNGYVYKGKLTNYDDVNIEIFDYKTEKYVSCEFENIAHSEVAK